MVTFNQIPMNVRVLHALWTVTVQTHLVVFHAHVLMDTVEMDFPAKVNEIWINSYINTWIDCHLSLCYETKKVQTF